MKQINRILMMADAPAGGGGAAPANTPSGAATPPSSSGAAPPPAAHWSDPLPDEIKNAPTIKMVPDIATLAKNYLHAEKMIGAKRTVIPGEKAPQAEWDALFNAIGRPETIDKYEDPEVKPADGVQLDKVGLDAFRKKAHEAGLTNKQYKEIMGFYLTGVNGANKNIQDTIAANTAHATETLRKDWGDKFDANLDIAKSTLRQFGGEEVFKELEGGLGNNIGLIKMLHKIGLGMLEDKSRGSGGLQVTGSTQAAQEIETLKTDAGFMKILGDPVAVGHKQAVDRWLDLHRRAHPGTVE